MKKFLVIYGAAPDLMEKWSSMPPEEQKKGMDAWVAWMGNHKDAMIDAGNPVGRNHRVSQSGVAEHRNELCGYSIMQGESREAVAAMLAENPYLDEASAYIELMEITEM